MRNDKSDFNLEAMALDAVKCRVDSYAERLAALSEINPVTLLQDLLGDKGDLLLSKYSVLNSQSFSAVSGCALSEALELHADIQCPLSVVELKEDLLMTVNVDAFYFSLCERTNLEEFLAAVCPRLEEFGILQQKLTVLKFSLPQVYSRSLYVGLLIFLMAIEMRLSRQQQQELFWAALCHDVGMLHVDDVVLNKIGALEFSDWEKIQSHVGLGCASLRLMPNFSDSIILAVSEHHERCDGTGYPLGKLESEISIEGQLLGLTDSVVAIHFNRFNANNGDWRGVLSVIQLNAQEYFHRGVQVLGALLVRKELPVQNVVVNNIAPEFTERLLEQNLRLKSWFEILKDTLTSIGYRHGDKRLHALQNIMLHIATSCRGANVFEDEFKELLRNGNAAISDNDLNKKLEEAVLLQQEVYYHLKKLSHMLDNYIVSAGHNNKAIQEKLLSCYRCITPYLN